MELNQQVLNRIKGLVAKGEAVLRATHFVSRIFPATEPSEESGTLVDTLLCSEWQNQSLVFLDDTFGRTHHYTQSFRESCGSFSKARASAGQGILRAILDDIQQGNISVIGLITAGVFSDFLEQADYLLEKEYTAPAAVLAGAVLESELRSIALREGIAAKGRDNISSLTQKLVDKGLYSEQYKDKLTFWNKVRNKAAHGEFEEVSKADVEYLIAGVRSLLNDVRQE